jgi:hypothetical protein
LEWQWLLGMPFTLTSLRMRATFFVRVTSTWEVGGGRGGGMG